MFGHLFYILVYAAISSTLLGGTLDAVREWMDESQRLPADIEELARLRRRDIHAGHAIGFALTLVLWLCATLFIVTSQWEAVATKLP